MVVLIKDKIIVYSSSNLTEKNIKETTSFFSNKNGNNTDCKFIGVYKDLLNLGYVVRKEIQNL